MPLKVSSAINSMNGERAKIFRYTGFLDTDGEYKQRLERKIPVLLSMQSAMGGSKFASETLQYTTFMERNQDGRLFFLSKFVRTSRDLDGTPADVLFYSGLYFKVVESLDWTPNGLYAVLAVRVPKDFVDNLG